MPANPAPLTSPPDPLSLPGSTVGKGPSAGLRRTIGYLVAAALCSLVGVALVYVPEKLVFAAVIAILSVIMVLLRPFVGLILYSAALFLRPAEIWPVLGPLHLERVVGALTLASLVFNSWLHEGHMAIDKSQQTRWLGLFWLSTFLSMPTSYWPTRSVEVAIEVLKIIAFYVMVVSLVNTRRRFSVFLWSYLGMMIYFAVSSVRDYYSGNFKFAQGIERALGETSSAGDPNQLGATMACTVPLLILMMGKERQPGKKMILMCGIAMCIWTLSLTGSRSSLLGFLGGLVYLWWISARRFRNGIVIAVLLVGGYSALPDQYKTRYGSMGASEVDASSQARLDAWKAGLGMFLDRPLFGVGVGCFGVAHATSYESGNWLESHSLYIQVPAELGVLGTVTFFGFLILSLKTFRKGRRMIRGSPAKVLEDVTLRGMIGAFIVLAITGVFGHNMLRPTWFVFAAMGQAIWRMASEEAGQSIGIHINRRG